MGGGVMKNMKGLCTHLKCMEEIGKKSKSMSKLELQLKLARMLKSSSKAYPNMANLLKDLKTY